MICNARTVHKASVSKAFLQQSRRINRTVAVRVQAYKVTLKTPTGTSEVECDAGTYILDAAEGVGVDLPYSCRAGACSSCIGIVEEGTVDQSGQSFLDAQQEDSGYVLTCLAYPTSDCSIVTHKEAEFYPQ